VTGVDLAPGAHRDGEGTCRGARPPDRLSRRRRGGARFSRGELRQALVDLWDHVRTRPRGRRLRACAGRAARGNDRAGELDPHERPGEDVQGDGAVPGGAAAEQPVRLG
jgi:hypothetical protein